MAPSISLLSLATLAWPLLLSAQTSPDLARILERLDRLEQENRALAGEVKALRSELAASREGRPPAAAADDSPPATVEQRLDIQQARIEEQAQTKVEASFIGVPGHAAKSFRKSFGVAMSTSGADLGASSNGIPCRIGPLDGGMVAHVVLPRFREPVLPGRPAPADPAIPATPTPDAGPPVKFVVGVTPAASTAAHDPASTGAVWFVTGRVRASCAEPGAAAEVAGGTRPKDRSGCKAFSPPA